ncbi:MAG: penicillin-binding transpeptidase domain-containing protein [Chlamydiales bacterium]
MKKQNVTKKANYMLYFFLVIIVLIAIRIGYLQWKQYNYYFNLSQKPQKKSILEPALRGIIYDRFSIPVALNQLQYNLFIYYEPIAKQIPRIAWEEGLQGRTKIFPRRDYIEYLSNVLTKITHCDQVRIKDLIYSKASIFPNTPILIQENLDEATYYRLKLLEKDFPGIHTKIQAKRFYPYHTIGSNLLGYMGRINGKEYNLLSHERLVLQNFLCDRSQQLPTPLPVGTESVSDVHSRLRTLERQSYSINDCVGKSGIEKQFDQSLRGIFGKQAYEIDVKGNVLRIAPNSYPPVPGKHIKLAISIELQEYAEKLLAMHEGIRDQSFSSNKQPPPWIKGGAIVAMIPNSGEVVAMASYPRYNPNDFINRTRKIPEWLENDTMIEDIWNGNRSLQKEIYDLNKNRYSYIYQPCTWSYFTQSILSPNSQIYKIVKNLSDLNVVHQILSAFSQLLILSGQSPMDLLNSMYKENSTFYVDDTNIYALALPIMVKKLRETLDRYLSKIPNNLDRLLFLDICQLCIDHNLFSRDLLEFVGNDSLSQYRKLTQSLAILSKEIQRDIRPLFYKYDFATWRENSLSDFLKEKRAWEKEHRRYAKPYLDYLTIEEQKLFKNFWEENRTIFISAIFFDQKDSSIPNNLQVYIDFLSERYTSTRDCSPESVQAYSYLQARLNQIPQEIAIKYLKTMRSYSELNRPLFGRYPTLPSLDGIQYERHLAKAFYPIGGYGFTRSLAYQQGSPLGSLFKIVTGYASLYNRWTNYHVENPDFELNPLTLIDNLQPNIRGKNGILLGSFCSGEPIYQIHKGGRIPRSSHKNIGKVDFIKAMEQSSNIYFSLLASNTLEVPDDLITAAKKFGFGRKTGLLLPGEASGYLPRDIRENITSLYSLAIGQHSLLVTPLQAAHMLNIVANCGKAPFPQIIQSLHGEQVQNSTEILSKKLYFPLQSELHRIGVSFPIFSGLSEKKKYSSIDFHSTEMQNRAPFPTKIHDYLMHSLQQVMIGERGSARGSVITSLQKQIFNKQIYNNLIRQVVGKTGTAEIVYRPTLDREGSGIICNHIWFGGISFPDEESCIHYVHPELIVVVFLRYGDYGKEAAPIAVQMIDKWRDLQKQHINH